jgi:NAD-dependent SIR2 family protein deacetylase
MNSDYGHLDNESVIYYVISYMTCGVCESTYRLEDVQVIDADDDMWAMVAKCPKCGAEGLILAFASPLDDEALFVGSDTQLTARWDSGLAPLTEDDVREWREFLESFHGDMKDLLQV